MATPGAKRTLKRVRTHVRVLPPLTSHKSAAERVRGVESPKNPQIRFGTHSINLAK